MQSIYFPAAERGHTRTGWLDSYHSFSFGNWYDPGKIQFGALRVLNDDKVGPAAGFGMHPHSNMEIVSIPLDGALLHKDSTGREGLIRAGDVQIMSAGTGIMHAETNVSGSEPVRFLQIWVFPKEKNIAPRYAQKTFPVSGRNNAWQVVVSPDERKGALWINQDAQFSLSRLDAGKSISYDHQFRESLIYIFVIEGEISVGGQLLKRRDALGMENGAVSMNALKDAEILTIEIPKH
jgi:redox-sensitive bicupin YhaK (pirin superfamily)